MARLPLVAVALLVAFSRNAVAADVAANPSACAGKTCSAASCESSCKTCCRRPQKVVQESTVEGNSSKDDLLREKIAQRDRLQKEIEQLVQELLAAKQFVIKFEVIEIDRQRAREAGMVFPPQSEESAQETKEQSLEQNLISKLKDNGFAHVLSDPAIVTTSGRQACLQIGGEIPVPTDDAGNVEIQQVGTHLEVTPTDLGDNRVRLDIHCKLSEVDENHSRTDDGKVVPAVLVRQFNATCETTLGESHVLAGASCRHSCKCKAESDTVLAVLVTAESAQDASIPVKTAGSCDKAACTK